jgi:hypothetical protein
MTLVDCKAHQMDSDRSPVTPWFLDVRAWTISLAIIGYPAAGLASAYLGVYDNTISIAYRLSVGVLALSSFCINGLRYGFRPLDSGLTLFLVVYAFRLIWDSGRSDPPNADMALLYFVVGSLIPLVGVSVVAGEWNNRNIAICFIVTGTIICVLTLYFYGTGLNINEGDAERLEFDKLNPISLSHTALSTAIVVVVGGSYWRSRLARIATLAILPLAGYIMFLTISRGAFVAGICCLSLLVFNRRLWFVVPIMIGALVWLFVVAPYIGGESTLQYFRISDLGVEDSSAYRLTLAQEAWSNFLDHPILGSAYALPGRGEYPHNAILETAMALGVGGLVLYLSLVVRSGISAIRHIGSAPAVCALIFFQYFIGAQFSGSIWDAPAVYIFMAYFLSLERERKRASMTAGRSISSLLSSH